MSHQTGAAEIITRNVDEILELVKPENRSRVAELIISLITEYHEESLKIFREPITPGESGP